MILIIKKYSSIFYINVIIFLLSIFTFEVNSETKIIAKEGDTLFKISRDYGIPLKVLMHKNNFNEARKIIEGEVVIIPIENSNQSERKKDNQTHRVIEGDTLYKISRAYNVNLKDIIALNNLGNNLSLRINQLIILPMGANKYEANNKDNIKQATKKVFYHITEKDEDLSNIAKIHRTTMNKINTLNKLNDPIKINPNIKLQIRENKIPKWRKYGSIMVNWSDWTYFDGNYVSKAKTKENTSFYIAISCKKRILNNSLKNSYWKEWYFPKTDFEFKLINDFCNKEFNF